MYKGGCYETTNAIGKTMCTKAAEGVCTAPASGYFVPGDKVANTEQSVVSCGDAATGVTVAADSGNKYKGIANCEECTTPDAAAGARATDKFAKCTKCSAGKYLKDDGSTTQCVATANDCGDGYAAKQDTDKGNQCVSCEDTTKGVTGCAKCTYDSAKTRLKCTKCKDPNYLKTAADGPTTCVAKGDCKDDYFTVDDPTNGHKCVSCGDTTGVTVDTNKKYVGVGGCAKCTEPAAISGDTGGTAIATCTKCTSNKLSPLGDACLAACPAGTYDSSNVCTPCHTSCSSCSDAASTSCTACYPGSVLSRATDSSTTGTCIPECTGKFAENCGANQYTAVLGGSKYCSRCKSGFVPVDGVCVSATTRTPNGCTPGDGVCSSCTSTYFLESGGCYQSTAYPGKTLCSNAADGKCNTCANTLSPDSNGVCPACPAGCSKCTASSNSQTCSECLAGYYKSGTSCVKCSENSADGNIKGVPNCVSCDPPSGNTGPVTCYVAQSSGPADLSRVYLHRELRRQFTLATSPWGTTYFWPSTSGTYVV
ncbi:Variant-specific surface protein [Giardia duodenalis]|uniref:Variant-specific surface protein n=1 Tax=Giardia intestinalis TaxID=5741 RepID=V6TSR2_GIAIN|nr:Variant-specific surface protein [Giardia intestinalis]